MRPDSSVAVFLFVFLRRIAHRAELGEDGSGVQLFAVGARTAILIILRLGGSQQTLLEGGSGGPLFDNDNDKPTDLFGSNAKGEWYFYNTSLKSKGFTEFKAKWGNRPNADNWRRLASIKQTNFGPLPTDIPNATAGGAFPNPLIPRSFHVL